MTTKTKKKVLVGDVVAVDSNNADERGGTVVAVYGEQVVFRQNDGTFDSWAAENVWIVVGTGCEAARVPPPPVLIAADVTPPTHDIKLGDVIAIVGEHSANGCAFGGEVIAVVGPIVVYRYPSGTIESDDAENFVVLARAADRADARPLRPPVYADEFRDEHSHDHGGRSLSVGDRVEYLEHHGAGVVVAVAGDKALTLCDYENGHIADGGFMYHGADELRVVMPIVDLREFVAAKRTACGKVVA